MTSEYFTYYSSTVVSIGSAGPRVRHRRLEELLQRLLLAAIMQLAFATVVLASAGPLSLSSSLGGPPPPPAPPSFGFSAVLGDWMVLQQQPSAAAVYGTATIGAKSVTVTVSDGKTSYDVTATVGKDATHQPIGYVDPSTGAQLPFIAQTWKALLKPTAAGGDYTITAKCKGCSGNKTNATLAHVTFGDMWYCSGQSNMWLPVQYSFSRNKSVAAIKAGKFRNIRGLFSASATTPTSGEWKTAAQAITDGNETHPTYSLFQVGAACWYFAQQLVERGVKTPIGIADTAIGGQRIEEFQNNATTYAGRIGCPDVVGETEQKTAWNGQLFAKQVMPFVDMTVKGFTWYQGENNMQNVKGNAASNVGYSCKQRELVKGWRSIWSTTPGTTDPLAPFGIVTLASSGSEGNDAAMGAMRLAQTAGYGVLPNVAIPNSFFAQAGDLEDAWGPASGPCFNSFASQWGCCDTKHSAYRANRTSKSCLKGTNGKPEICDAACAAAAGTPTEGGIHPRSKLPVGERLAAGAFNLVYGGSGAMTGPTLSSCSLDTDAAAATSATSLTIEFNISLMRGEKLMLNAYNSSLNNEIAPPPPLPAGMEQCFAEVKKVCASHLHNDSDCRNCKTDVPGAWEKLQPVCGSRREFGLCAASSPPLPPSLTTHPLTHTHSLSLSLSLCSNQQFPCFMQIAFSSGPSFARFPRGGADRCGRRCGSWGRILHRTTHEQHDAGFLLPVLGRRPFGRGEVCNWLLCVQSQRREMVSS